MELNLIKILKDCPEGTKLYSPAFGDVFFYGIDQDADEEDRQIICYTPNKKFETLFFYDGTLWASDDAECMLFPSKNNRDWSTFKVEKPK